MNKAHKKRESLYGVKGWFEERFKLREIIEKKITKKKNTKKD